MTHSKRKCFHFFPLICAHVTKRKAARWTSLTYHRFRSRVPHRVPRVPTSAPCLCPSVAPRSDARSARDQLGALSLSLSLSLSSLSVSSLSVSSLSGSSLSVLLALRARPVSPTEAWRRSPHCQPRAPATGGHLRLARTKSPPSPHPPPSFL